MSNYFTSSIQSLAFITFLLFFCITSLSGCSQAPAIPKDGDEVMWRLSSELIIKAKLGQRREHVIVDAKD